MWPTVAAIHTRAFLQAGACFVALDPAYPADRLGGCVEDAAPAALLTVRQRRGLAKVLRARSKQCKVGLAAAGRPQV